MLIFASWYDAGTVQGTIQRFREFSNLQRIFVGAWSHGANSNADPFLVPSEVESDREQQRLGGSSHPPSRMSTAKREAIVQVFNEMHGLIVGVGKNYCKKSQPECEQCPLQKFLPDRKSV